MRVDPAASVRPSIATTCANCSSRQPERGSGAAWVKPSGVREPVTVGSPAFANRAPAAAEGSRRLHADGAAAVFGGGSIGAEAVGRWVSGQAGMRAPSFPAGAAARAAWPAVCGRAGSAGARPEPSGMPMPSASAVMPSARPRTPTRPRRRPNRSGRGSAAGARTSHTLPLTETAFMSALRNSLSGANKSPTP
jgi:hypothetical protein